MNWYNKNVDEVLEQIKSSLDGLSSAEAKERLANYGNNELVEKKKKPAWMIFVNQFKDIMILILAAAAIISGLLGDKADTIIILVIVFLNAFVGFIQEYRAGKAMEALKQMANPHANVMRDKKVSMLKSSALVPGDIVLLDAGNTVPADLRLCRVQSIKISEASLTGESLPSEKTTNVIQEQDPPLGDRNNMAYKGTQVTNGRASGVVVATGMQTEIGKIAKMLQEKEETTPLQKRMLDFGKKLSFIILGICIILFVTGLLRGEKTLEMLLISISLAVAAIPEALPALITIALSNGAKRLVTQNVLIRKLAAVETLGSVTFICSDKTGTLTQNKMSVVNILPGSKDGESIQGLEMLQLGMALNQTVLKQDDAFTGDPTETAMVEYIIETYGEETFDKVVTELPLVHELPFDSERKGMSTIHNYDGKFLLISKGALEFIVDRLKDKDDEGNITENARKMAAEGVRVIAFGYRFLEAKPDDLRDYNAVESDLSFAGLTGLIDPPREGIGEAINECRTAGIKPVMITGDHKETAVAIARQIGLITGNELAVTGKELEKMAPAVFEEQVESIAVYARVSPQQKLDIVKALQKKNHFVAMTGDGVNDAPSLKKANIGIAMGITGTDVSKEAAHMILLNDNFTSIVKAVREGRRIYDNIRKFVKYIMACNSAEVLTIFLAPFAGLPIPLLPVHILWINLVTDGLPGLALSTEKEEADIMQRPPRKPGESLFAQGTGIHIIWVGVLMALITLGIQAWYIHQDNMRWQTMVFTVLSLSQLANVFANRSDTESTYRKGIFSNKLLVFALAFTFLLQLGVIYIPFANAVFKTQPLTLTELLICLLAATAIFHAVELEKWIKRKYKKRVG